MSPLNRLDVRFSAYLQLLGALILSFFWFLVLFFLMFRVVVCCYLMLSVVLVLVHGVVVVLVLVLVVVGAVIIVVAFCYLFAVCFCLMPVVCFMLFVVRVLVLHIAVLVVVVIVFVIAVVGFACHRYSKVSVRSDYSEVRIPACFIAFAFDSRWQFALGACAAAAASFLQSLAPYMLRLGVHVRFQTIYNVFSLEGGSEELCLSQGLYEKYPRLYCSFEPNAQVLGLTGMLRSSDAALVRLAVDAFAVG